MSILFFDTETTGLPPKNNIKKTKWYNDYPNIVQLSWILYNEKNNKIVSTHDYIIKLENNKQIPFSSTKIHGITNKKMNEFGVDIKTVLQLFIQDMDSSKMIVAHNMQFDILMLKAEMLRNYGVNYFDINKKKEYCTMMNSIELCKIRKVNRYGRIFHKYPKLVELHIFLFGTTPKNLHNSFNDVLVCLRCFYKLTESIDILEKNIYIKKLFDSKL